MSIALHTWELAKALLIGSGVLLFCGYGLARLLLPRDWQGLGWYAVPGLGLAGIVVTASWLTLLLPMQLATWVVLLLFAGVNLAALRWGRALLSPAWREGVVVLGLVLLVLGMGLFPILGRPELTTVGPNWDFEIYLPLAEYIREYPVGFSLEQTAGLPFPGPPNPLLWRLNFFDTRSGGLGFSLFHSLVSVLAGQEAYQNFSALLALLLAASIPSVYLFYRGTLRLGAGLALAALGLVALNGSVFFIFFWSFAQQLASFVLMPLALAAGAAALRPSTSLGGSGQAPSTGSGQALLERRPQAMLLGGLMLAALLVTFTPVVPLYAAAMALFAALILVVRRRDLALPLRQAQDRPGPAALLKAALLLGVASLALSPMSYARLAARGYYFLTSGGIGGLTFGPSVLQFAPTSWAYGTGPLELPQKGLLYMPAAQTGAVLSFLSLGLVIGVVLLSLLSMNVAFRRGEHPLLAFGLAAPILLLLVRFVWPYPYGYLKLIPSCVFLLIAVLAYGVGVLWRWLWRQSESISSLSLRGLGLSGLRLLTACFLALLVGLNLSLAYLSVWQARSESDQAFNGLTWLKEVVPPGSSVYVSSHPGLQGPRGGALVYFLRRALLFGDFNTAYSTFYRFRPDGVYDYALFHRDETAHPELSDGEGPQQEVSELTLDARPKEVLWFLDFSTPEAGPKLRSVAGRNDLATWSIDGWLPSGYPDFRGWSAPLLGFTSREAPAPTHYPVAGKGQPFTLLVAAEGLAAAPSPEWDASTEKGPSTGVRTGQREVAVTLATLREQNVRFLLGDEERAVRVPSGLSSYFTGPVAVPTQLGVWPDGDTPLYIKSAQLRVASSGGERLVRHEQGVLLRSRVEMESGVARGHLELLTPGFVPVLDIYSIDKRQHFGWWSLPEHKGPGPQRVDYTLDLLTKRGSVGEEAGGEAASLDAAQVTSFQTWPTGDGTYLAALFLWKEQEVKRAVPLFEFTVYNGTIQRFRSALPSLFVG